MTAASGRLFVRAVILIGAVLVSLNDHGLSAADRRQPNIVILLADDLGYGELGCQGNPEIPTPHIDSIAKNGIRFTSAYVTASYCSASRAGLLTGRYPTRFGYEFNPIGAYNEDPRVGLPASERTIARHLHDAGYATGLVGKWHLGGHAKYHPQRRGFDEFFGFLHEGHYYVPPPHRGVTTMLRRKTLPVDKGDRWTSKDGRLVLTAHMKSNEPAYDANNPILRGSQPVNEKLYLTNAFTREAVDFIGRNAERPFFLYVAYNAVHSPLQGADSYMRKHAHIKDVHRRIFAAMLSNLDDSVGAILKKLRDEKLERDTLVIFLSDNGGPTRELTSSNKPLRGGKGDLYEGGIRIPFLMQWPGTLPSKKRFVTPITSLDLYPTAAALSGLPIPPKQQCDGVNLLPFLAGKLSTRPHRELFWRMGRKAALRKDDWKLVSNPGRKGRVEWELYDLSKDPGETRNLAASQRNRLLGLVTAWTRLNREMKDPFWKPER